MDAGADTSRNAEMFAAVQDALADQDAICLFPEGISHVSGRLEPLRSGAARMVLSSAAAGCPVTIVPVGLNFDRLPMFRSRVVAIFGQPFDAADLVDLFGRDPVDAIRALTLVPFAVVGVCGFAPPCWLTSAFSRSDQDLQSRATWKVVGGVVIYAAWMGTLATAAGMWAGLGAGLVTGLGLPLLAFAGLAAFEREAAAIKLVRAFLTSRQTPLTRASA